MELCTFFPSPVGLLRLAEEDGFLTRLDFSADLPAGAAEGTSPLLEETKKQLSEYFAGSRKVFALPLAPKGTPFRQKVWQALCTIPWGETRTYGEIAAQIGQPKASRAVGMANHHNPISIIIPCHRVVGKNGSLTGYAGGLSVKSFLLELER